MANAQQQPAFTAYSVLKREGQDDYWMALGAAFPHADGKGYNVVLQATPLDGKIVLRERKESESLQGTNQRSNVRGRERRDR
jgi:hypothetical protein